MLEPLDRLSVLLDTFPVSASLLFTGALCGLKSFDPRVGHGYLHVLREGAVELIQRDCSGKLLRQIVSQPTLFFYTSPLAHIFNEIPSQDAKFACATVIFEGGGNHPLLSALPPVIILPLSNVGGLNDVLNLLFKEADQVSCGRELIITRLFDVVLFKLLRWLLDHGEEVGVDVGLLIGLADPLLARSLNAVHQFPHFSWTLDSLAREAGMSRSSFAISFKTALGMSPIEYLTNWRLSLTKKLLRQGKTIKVIANAVGYANASALSRVFLKKTGFSTKQWLAISS